MAIEKGYQRLFPSDIPFHTTPSIGPYLSFLLLITYDNVVPLFVVQVFLYILCNCSLYCCYLTNRFFISSHLYFLSLLSGFEIYHLNYTFSSYN